MKILKIDHIGIAVNSTEDGKNFWSGILGLDFEGDETVDTQKVKTAFFPVGESEVELLESPRRTAPLPSSLKKRRGHSACGVAWTTSRPPLRN
ncbi:MAG: VOC family protein [Desulfobacterales bacterium]